MSVALVHLDELEAIELPDGFVWRPVRRRFGIAAFGVNVYTPGTSRQIVETHTERSLEHEEIYLVLRGRVRFTVGDDEHELSTGQLVHVQDTSLRRGAVALSDDAAVLAIGGKPGKAYAVSAWEAIFAAHPHLEAGRWDEAIRLHEEALAGRPGHPPLLYNLACIEARAGRGEQALAHLAEAVELHPEYAKQAAEDEDFVSIRDDPRFPSS